MRASLENALAGGDRRSVGKVSRVVAAVVAEPERLAELVAALSSTDAVVSMRAADALEKLAREHAPWLAPYRARLLQTAARARDPAVRWNLIQLLPGLSHSLASGRRLARHFTDWFRADPSAIVRACALEAIVTLAGRDPTLRPSARRLIHGACADRSPAVRARARRLRPTWLSPGSRSPRRNHPS